MAKCFKMKKILGLDLGTNSIGWAYVYEAEKEGEKSSIKKLGVRVVPLTAEEETNFITGKAISTNAERTLKRGARRNLDRFQLRREKLITILKKHHIISENFIYSEEGKQTTFSTYKIRAKAATEKVTKEEFAKVLLAINKKRGYKSNRKTKKEDEGSAVNSIDVAKYIYENNLTPGQYVYELLKNNKKTLPDFYRSDLKKELDKIWDFQKQFYPEILTDELKNLLEGKNAKQTWAICKEPFNIEGIKLKGKADEQKLQRYKFRTMALEQKIDLEQLAIVLQEINSQIKQSSTYLGGISDRSKELYFNKQTVGQYLYAQLKENKHAVLKNQVFYRQDYIDEFERIWETQKQYHPELTNELKKIIRDEIIFYQRPLKSQKGLLSYCQFEKRKKKIIDKETGKEKIITFGHKVIPKSSPLFQEFKIWTILNNIEIRDKINRTKRFLELEEKELLFEELNVVNELSSKNALKLLGKKPGNYELNYEKLEGNKTNALFYNYFEKILNAEGVNVNLKKLSSAEAKKLLVKKFNDLGINTSILEFDSDIKGNDFDKQPIMRFWHLLYSFVEDNSKTGNEKLIEKLNKNFGFPVKYAKIIAEISFKNEYGSLSSRAIRKILPHLKAGNSYDLACSYAGYNHSHSKTKEELEKRELKPFLEILPKNSLRNPVVEKILNQMVNVVNAIISDDELGKPDEIRIELARELKYSAKKREEMTKKIREATKEHEKIREILSHEPFNISKVTRNDIIRYKLWKELEPLGYKTLYTNTYIPKEKLFTKEVDIEHIIPKARTFDDSFSNKTLAIRSINIEKGDNTAYDFLSKKLSKTEFEQYIARVENLYKLKKISKSKYIKLLLKNSEIDDGFIKRDLRNTQYIAKKAKEMLEEVVRTVNTTSGKITDRLRSDWQLIDVLKELNLDKYERVGLVETIQGKDGKSEKIIIDWSKRNDHRHHAMDALTVAFTKPVFVQYLNNLSARKDEKNEMYHTVYGIEQKYLHRNKNGKLLFNPPIPIKEFRKEAKKHLESILVSIKAKNKVVTRNINRIKIKGKNNYKEQSVLTPRGKLHEETVYGKIGWSRIKLDDKISNKQIELIKDERLKNIIKEKIKTKGSIKKAFGKDSAEKIMYKGKIISEVTIDKSSTTKRIEIASFFTDSNKTKSAKEKTINNIIDIKVREIIQNRLDEYAGDFKKAFSNLEKNPIWLDKKRGIKIKRVTIFVGNDTIPIHYKKDHNGKFILDKKGLKIPVDFVVRGNNHHVAIYEDEKGQLQERVVSFFDAVQLKNNGLPVVDKTFNQHLGWKFLFSMKQNEYFVFPNDEFELDEEYLLNPANTHKISTYLFRVQKLTTKDYVFRHHLETTVENKKELKDIVYKRVGLNGIIGIVKVRINHLGKIVHVGEY